MALLMLVKLYWVWIIVGLIILVPSVVPPGFSFLGAIVGGLMLLMGLIFRKAMQSEQFKNRIERNL